MSKGFLSCIGYEYKGSLHQYLNIVEPKDLNVELIATALMRLVHSECSNDYSHSSAVDSVELELRFEENRLKVPRIMNSTALNRRYAAKTRAAQQQLDIGQFAVDLSFSGDRVELLEAHEDLTEDSLSQPQSTVQLRVRHSVSTAFKINQAGFLNLILGEDVVSKSRVVAVTHNHSSIVSIPSSWCAAIPESIGEAEEHRFLGALAHAVLAKSLVDEAAPNTSILIHGANEFLEFSIWCQAVAKGRPHPNPMLMIRPP